MMTGIALVKAIEVLEEGGYRFHRVAGTSAGAIGCRPDYCLGVVAPATRSDASSVHDEQAGQSFAGLVSP